MTDKDTSPHDEAAFGGESGSDASGGQPTPESGRTSAGSGADASEAESFRGDASDPATGEPVEDAAFIEAEGPDVETSTGENIDFNPGAPGAGTPDKGETVAGDDSQANESQANDDGLNEDDLNFLDAVSAGAADELAAERLADLQRVTAEYANYRKRTEANREIERERTVGEVVKILLPVLDDLDRAEKHGDLVEGPFASIAGKLRTGVERFGLKPFGAAGDPFNPQIHEAIFQQPSADVEAETVADVVETGYYLGSTLLRAAKVVVAVPNG